MYRNVAVRPGRRESGGSPDRRPRRRGWEAGPPLGARCSQATRHGPPDASSAFRSQPAAPAPGSRVPALRASLAASRPVPRIARYRPRPRLTGSRPGTIAHGLPLASSCPWSLTRYLLPLPEGSTAADPARSPGRATGRPASRFRAHLGDASPLVGAFRGDEATHARVAAQVFGDDVLKPPGAAATDDVRFGRPATMARSISISVASRASAAVLPTGMSEPGTPVSGGGAPDRPRRRGGPGRPRPARLSCRRLPSRRRSRGRPLLLWRSRRPARTGRP